MTKQNNRSNRERMRYGICLNDECQMCKDKTVQQIPMRKDFVCSECGKELRECPPPKKASKTPLIVVAAILVLGALVGGIAVFWRNTNKLKEKTVIEAAAQIETGLESVIEAIQEEAPVAEEILNAVASVVESSKADSDTPVRAKASAGSGTIKLSYGIYTGATKGGYPHGQGKLTYSTSRQINRNDIKARTANPGDYVIGEFYNGFVVYGKLYDSTGNLLGSLNFGVGSESSYDSK